MKSEDFDPFVTAMTQAANRTHFQLSPEVVDQYFRDLEPFPLAEVCAAIHRISMTEDWFPKLPRIVRELTPREPDALEVGARAWDALLPLLKDSRTAARRCDDPLAVKAVARMGGFARLGAVAEKDLQWERKAFVERYVEMWETETSPTDRWLAECEAKDRPPAVGATVRKLLADKHLNRDDE